MATSLANAVTSTSPQRSRNLRPTSRSGSTTASSRLSRTSRSNSHNSHSNGSSGEASELRENRFSSSSGSESHLVIGGNSASYEGGRLPSLIGFSSSSRGSVVASLNENFIPNSKTKRRAGSTNATNTNGNNKNGTHARTSSDGSSSYVDHCGWTNASIDADAADTRRAIQPARGEKKTKLLAAAAAAQLSPTKKQEPVLVAAQGGVRNPLAKPAAAAPVVTPPSPSKRTLAESGRKRSVRIHAPPDQPRAVKTATALPSIQSSQQPSKALQSLPSHQPQLSLQLLQDDATSPNATRQMTQNRIMAMQAQQQFMQMQYLQQQQFQQQQQQQQRFMHPPPLNEGFVSAAAHQQQLQQQQAQASPGADARSRAIGNNAAESPLTNSSSTNETKTLPSGSPRSAKSSPKGLAAMKQRIFFCGGKKEDVATENRSTSSSGS